MGKTLVLGFEGMPGSGKTLISNYLNGFLHPYVVIPEISCCPMPLDVSSSEKMMQRDIWHLEQNRSDLQVAQRLKDVGIHVGLDRTYVSTLAFSYALSKTQGTDHFDNIERYFASRKGDFEGNIDAFIYFDLSVEESMERFEKKCPIARPMRFFTQPAFLREMQVYYDRFFGSICQDKIIRFNISDKDYKKIMEELERKLAE